MYHAVILAGGQGTRLWPASRANSPKHLLVVEPPQTLLQATLERLSDLIPPDRIWIVTNQSQALQIADSLPHFDAQHIWAEPLSRDTAPSVGWAAAKLCQIDSDAVMCVLPADHIINPASGLCETLRCAEEIVSTSPEYLVTIGIVPSSPATSYGYIQRGSPYETSKIPAFHVRRFCEKPEAACAESFYHSGEFYWNAGIFVWKAETILQLLRRFEPEIGRELDHLMNAAEKTVESFQRMKSISIDYAVMERAENVVVLEAAFDWNDVGTWSALDRLFADQKDRCHNRAVSAKIVAIDSTGCTVRCDDPSHIVALIGLHDIVVIQTADATLIARKDQDESVRQIVEELKNQHHD